MYIKIITRKQHEKVLISVMTIIIIIIIIIIRLKGSHV